jgi:hypothetical protein
MTSKAAREREAQRQATARASTAATDAAKSNLQGPAVRETRSGPEGGTKGRVERPGEIQR